MTQKLKTKCPICKKPAELDYKPFCSRRCQQVDLHRWMEGVYSIPLQEKEGESQKDDEID